MPCAVGQSQEAPEPRAPEDHAGQQGGPKPEAPKEGVVIAEDPEAPVLEASSDGIVEAAQEAPGLVAEDDVGEAFQDQRDGVGAEAEPAQDDEVVGTTIAGRYLMQAHIGGGQFGSVYRALDTHTQQTVAVKTIQRLDEYQGIQPHIIREVSLLRDLQHENIVKFLSVHQSPTAAEFHLVFEYLDMDLGKFLREMRHEGQLLPLPYLMRFTRDLLSGIHACHVRLVVHRDLKPHNLLIGPQGLKIADFGLARLFSFAPGKEYTSEVITLWYRAPELLMGRARYNTEVDMWSTGCIFAEMATGRPLFPSNCEIGTLFEIFKLLGTPSEDSFPGVTSMPHFKSTFPQWPGRPIRSVFQDRLDLGPESHSFLAGLLRMDTSSRFSARQAKKHPFVTTPRDSDLPVGSRSMIFSGVGSVSAAMLQSTPPAAAAAA